ALKGKKVLLVDADVRRCSLSMMLDRRPKHGLTSFLSDEDTELGSLIVHDVFGDGVDMLPAGIIPPNPTELLYSKRLKELFSTARNHYDLILIDCPPIEIVADATIIKDYADVTIFIVRAGVMDRRALKEVEKLFEEKEYNDMLLLLNGAEFVSGRYGKYRYGYSYGYGAGYGYGRKGDEAYGYHGAKKNDR
ncbi:MAG: CpsD/CapB family tyrosine-protein kinase, partial [Alloprevotella sp.]|nr:CpsD/CapB family tyrosine-protein kinase [Alloprevotella sp.]